MLVKLLGGIDVLAGSLLIFMPLIEKPITILLIFGILLLVKSILGFFKDFGSWIDLFAGAILLLSVLINVYWLITIIAGILVLQKGVFSFL